MPQAANSTEFLLSVKCRGSLLRATSVVNNAQNDSIILGNENERHLWNSEPGTLKQIVMKGQLRLYAVNSEDVHLFKGL
jgi:hypothetical protein